MEKFLTKYLKRQSIIGKFARKKINNKNRIFLIKGVEKLMKISFNEGVKFYLIQVIEQEEMQEINQKRFYANTIPEFFSQNLQRIELSEFALLSSRIAVKGFKRLPIAYISYLVIGIHSVIGYNPFIENTIQEVLDWVEQLNCKLKYITLTEQESHNFIWDNIECSWSKDNQEVQIVSLKATEELSKLKKKAVTLVFQNDRFDINTLIICLVNFEKLTGLKNTDVSLEEIISFFEEKFPNQLRDIDLSTILKYYYSQLNRLNTVS